MKEQPRAASSVKISTGIPGLDHVLGGGLRPDRLYLVLGDPGVGKTTLALQFLLEGVRRGEPCLYATLSETKEEIKDIADAHGWSLDGLEIIELHSIEDSLRARDVQTMFRPAEIDLEEFTAPLFQKLEHVKPVRAVIDSLSELRVLAQEQRRFRRHIMTLKARFTGPGCTLLLLDDRAPQDMEMVPQTFAHGVVVLEAVRREYGAPRRRLRVPKLRGARIREGHHDFQIVTGGLVVYPRLVAADHVSAFPQGKTASGVAALDAMLGGGLRRGTSTLVMGPAGTGKSVLVSQYVSAAAARGEPSSVFVFDEARETFLARAAGAGMDLAPHLASGRVHLQQINPAEMTPGQFARIVFQAVEQGGARLVVIDSLNGYLSSVPEDTFLPLHVHELLTALGQLGVVTLVTLAQHGIIGQVMETGVDVSYLADTIIALCYFEAMGEMRKAVGVPKMRSGFHERSLREYRISASGLEIGEPLREFQGVLTGTPTYVGPREPLLGGGEHAPAR